MDTLQDSNHALLQQMLADYRKAPAIYQTSAFWEKLAAHHCDLVQRWGLNYFKRTVNRRYFNWGMLGILAHQFHPVFIHWLRRTDPAVLKAEFPDFREPRGEGMVSFNPAVAWLYKVYVAMLAHYVSQQDPWRLCQTIDEPAIGHPLRIRYRDRWFSQDLCNSIHEFYSACDCRLGNQQRTTVVELGAGYGRLAYVFLKALPACSYCIIDIPPALYLAQEYLTALFPNEKVFRYRPFQSYKEIKNEFEAARLRFLMAHQIEMLPSKQFDLVINISSFHEMTSQQIHHYFEQIDRLCRSRFYMKQWRKSRATENQFVIRQNEYPIPATWHLVRQRQHPIQRWFFDALYEVQ